MDKTGMGVNIVNDPQMLPVGATLQGGKYKVVAQLAHGGFGKTYKVSFNFTSDGWTSWDNGRWGALPVFVTNNWDFPQNDFYPTAAGGDVLGVVLVSKAAQTNEAYSFSFIADADESIPSMAPFLEASIARFSSSSPAANIKAEIRTSIRTPLKSRYSALI